MSALRPGGTVRTAAAVTLCAVVAMMPAFLVGASGVFLREDLGFGRAGLGGAVAMFFAGSAVFSIGGGRLAERIGARRSLVIVGLGNGLVMLGIAVAAQNLGHLLVLLLAGGGFNGIAQPATNLAIARADIARSGLVFGAKQSAVPLATMLAGASVPLLAVTVGWRWSFVAGAALSLVAGAFSRVVLAGGTRLVRQARRADAAVGGLVALAFAAGVGFTAATALGSFLVEAAVADGLAAGTAGWLLSGGSAAGVAARLSAGWFGDRHAAQALPAVSVMLGLGAVGYWLLALGGPAPLVLGTLVAYAFGWGWPGLMWFAVVRRNPNAPAAATGIVQAGAATGAGVGPLVFGLVASATSFATAWLLAGLAALASAGLVLASGWWMERTAVAARRSREG